MDTSLHTDTLHGVQPTLIGNYMTSALQAPRAPCTTEFLGVECGVRHTRSGVVDSESELLGLDRKITKQEPPRHMLPSDSAPPTAKATQLLVDSYSPFEPIGTRTKRPGNVLSGVSIDRFEYPHAEPQVLQNIVFAERHRGGLHSRMVAKDAKASQ